MVGLPSTLCSMMEVKYHVDAACSWRCFRFVACKLTFTPVCRLRDMEVSGRLVYSAGELYILSMIRVQLKGGV